MSNCQQICKSGSSCQNKAKYNLDGKLLCGVHGKEGTPLPKEEEDFELCKKEADANLEAGYLGNIQVARLSAPSIPGYVKIFPNFKHGNRKDGVGLPGLSPMSLGPVKHNMPNFPPACNLENYYQGAKIFPGEVDQLGNMTPEAIETRKKMYLDKTPYRHKYKVPYYTGKQVKTPLYSIYYTRQGEPRKLNYIQSRYMYCHYYQELVQNTPDYHDLINLSNDGYNLLIIGYDGHPIEKTLWEYYNDPSTPFGQELVLYTLLVVNDPEEYPWNKYYQANKQIYTDL